MSSVREELAAEEKKLARLLKAPMPDGSRARAATDALRSTAESVRRLRLRAGMEPTAREHMSALAARRRVEDEQRAKRKESAKREPARKAAKRLLAFAHPELVGARLDASRLSIKQGEELLELVEQRRAGELSGRKQKRYEGLVGTLAGEPALFERKRKEAESTAAEADALERARVEAMPLRRFEGRGGVYLPAYLFSWLMTPTSDGLNVTDVGILAAILFGLEHGRSPFLNSEVDAGAITLDGSAKYQLLPYLNPEGELSASRVSEAVRYLADSRWLELETAAGRTRIRPGERARRELEEATLAVT